MTGMRPRVPEALARLDLDVLVGLTVDQARAAVTAAGGILRTHRAGEPVTADFRPARVTVRVSGDRVEAVDGLG